MYAQLHTYALIAFVAFIVTICWLAFSPSGDSTYRGNAETTEPDQADGTASLQSLVEGDAVIVTGKAAGDFERIVRPVTAADRNCLWVDGHRYSRTDGRQIDVPWFEIEQSRIEVEPEWLE